LLLAEAKLTLHDFYTTLSPLKQYVLKIHYNIARYIFQTSTYQETKEQNGNEGKGKLRNQSHFKPNAPRRI